MCYLGSIIRIHSINQKNAILAFRSWKKNLKSQLFGMGWSLNEITCCDEAPELTNSHGLYSFKTIQMRNKHMRYWHLPISGTIKIWGTVIEHAYGYRSSHALIVNTRGIKAGV